MMKAVATILIVATATQAQSFAPISCAVEGEVLEDVLPPYALSDDPFPYVVVPIRVQVAAATESGSCSDLNGETFEYAFRQDELPLRQGERVPIFLTFSMTDFLSNRAD